MKSKKWQYNMGEFEKDIRDMFTDLEIPIDTNELWPGIVKGLEKKDKKYPIWWFFVPIVLLIVGGIYFINTNQTKDNTRTSEQFVKNQDNSEINNSVANITKTDDQKEIKSNNEISIKSSESEIESAQNSKKIKKYNNISILKNNDKTYRNNILNQQELNTSNLINEDKKVDFKISKSIINSENKTNNSFIVNHIKTRLYLTNFDRNFNLKMNSIKVFDKTPKIKKSVWEKSIDVGVGFAFVNKNLKLTNEDYASYKTKRIETESYLEAITSNIGLNLKHKSGFFISSGLNYTQIDERFSDNDSIDIYKQNEGVTKQFQESDGKITTLRGQKEVIEHKTWDKIIYNYYFFLDIPLSVGYSFDINRIKFEVSTGVSYNLAFLKKGQIIGLEGYPVDITEDANLFKKSSGISLISNMKVLFPYKKYLFYLEPNIKYNLNKVSLNKNPLEQRYFTYGIQIGSRFNF